MFPAQERSFPSPPRPECRNRAPRRASIPSGEPPNPICSAVDLNTSLIPPIQNGQMEQALFSIRETRLASCHPGELVRYQLIPRLPLLTNVREVRDKGRWPHHRFVHIPPFMHRCHPMAREHSSGVVHRTCPAGPEDACTTIKSLYHRVMFCKFVSFPAGPLGQTTQICNIPVPLVQRLLCRQEKTPGGILGRVRNLHLRYTPGRVRRGTVSS